MVRKDGGVDLEEAKAIMSVWDSKSKESMRIDLWTKEMPVDEMKIFFHQTLVAMSDTFHRATGDEKMAETMKDFCEYFAEKVRAKKWEVILKKLVAAFFSLMISFFFKSLSFSLFA
jgi:gliding motility-associated protein GldC